MVTVLKKTYLQQNVSGEKDCIPTAPDPFKTRFCISYRPSSRALHPLYTERKVWESHSILTLTHCEVHRVAIATLHVNLC